MSTRELAIITWLFGIVIVCLLSNKLRPFLFKLIEAAKGLAVHPVSKIVLFYQIIILIICGWSIVHFNLSWWILKDYLVVFFTTVISFLGGYRALKFWNAVLSSLGMGALFQFILGNYTFSYGIEVMLVPLVALLTVLAFVSQQQKDYRAFKLFHEVLGIIGIILIFYVFIKLIINWRLELNIVYWEGYLIEAIALVVNLPLMFFSFPLFQYDEINSIRKSKQNIWILLKESVQFWLQRIIFSYLLFYQLDKKVDKMIQGGYSNKRLIIILKKGNTVKEAKQLEKFYELAFAKRTDYKDAKKVIPIRIECRIDEDRHLIIKPYEIPDLLDIYKLG